MDFNAYVLALFAGAGDGTNFKLAQKQLDYLSSHIVKLSLWREYCKSQTIGDVNASSVKFLKNIGGTLKNKTTIGDGDGDPMDIPSETITFYTPLYIKQLLAAADMAMGIPNASAMRLMKFMDQFEKAHEVYAFSTAEKVISDNAATQESTFDFNKSTPQEIYNKIVQLGTKLSLLKNDKEGLHFVSPQSIIISVEPTIMDKLASVGLAGNRMAETFAGGQYSITIIGGYKVVANPFLEKYKVIVGADFSGGNSERIIAANIKEIGASNDLATYFEALGLAGVVYKSTFFGIKQVDTPPSASPQIDSTNLIDDQNEKFNLAIKKLEDKNKTEQKKLDKSLQTIEKLNKKISSLENIIDKKINSFDEKTSENIEEIQQDETESQSIDEVEDKTEVDKTNQKN